MPSTPTRPLGGTAPDTMMRRVLMDSIVFTHTGTCSGDACSLESALEHLSGYLDAERDTLACILAQAGCIHAASVLDTLAQLHLEPNAVEADLRDLLEEAEACLFLLLET